MKDKRILILGSNEKFSIEKMYERSFKSLNYKVNFFHIYQIRKNFFYQLTWKYFRFFYFFFIRSKIKNYLKKNQNYNLIIIFKGLYLNKKFASQIKSICKNSKLINIFTDNPFDTNYFKDISNKNILNSITEFDNIFIFSKKILKLLKKKYPNNSFSYLPFAYDPFYHKKNKNFKIQYDISFVGTADNERYTLINSLKEYSIILAGDGWKKYNLPKNIRYVSNADARNYSFLISKSKFSLNILRKQNKDSHNMKTFEIPSMGGLQLTEKNHDQNNFFPENRACVMYRNIKDIKLIINKYNKNFKKYNKIRKKGYAIARKNSYKDRIRFLMKTIYD